MKTLPAIAFVAMCFGACSSDEPGLLGDSGEANDDLVGRELQIRTSEPRMVPPGESVQVQPTIAELDDGTLLIGTEDLRVDADSPTMAVTVDNEPWGSDQFGIRVEMKEPGKDGWVEMRPWHEDSAWLWTSVTFSYDDGDVHLSGTSIRYTDSLDGLAYAAKEMASSTLDYSSGPPEIRYLVIPAWNYWDWDEGAYEATVNFNKITCSYNGNEYPAGTVVGPFECQDGRWTRND